MPVARFADAQKRRYRQRALETGPDAEARKDRERELASFFLNSIFTSGIPNLLSVLLLSHGQIVRERDRIRCRGFFVHRPLCTNLPHGTPGLRYGL